MKRNICFLLLLCLFFRASSQDQNIKIGQKVPDVLLNGVSGLYLNGKDAGPSVRLSAFAGKLLIIDFWATWCAPCRTMVPVMDSLQKQFGDKIVFLPVTYESADKTAPVLAALQRIHPFNLPEVTGDKVLHRLFPHRALPHYVWIDGRGTVRAISEFSEVNAKNIRDMLNGNPSRKAAVMVTKKDSVTAYNGELPLLVNGNGGNGSALKYHSLLTGFMPGLSGGMRITQYDERKGQQFSVTNVPFVWLCRLAFRDSNRWFPDSKLKVLSRDSLLMNSHLVGQAYEAWQADGHGYCYELLVPPALATNAFGLIRQDLSRLFPQYAVTAEPQVRKCIVLVQKEGTDRIRSAGGKYEVEITPYKAHLRNSSLLQLMMRLEHQYLQNSPLPIVDGTGYTGKVDLDLEGKLYDVASLNAALAPYGLQFVEKDASVEMLVIRDATTGTALKQIK